jgi:hypothetical protein
MGASRRSALTARIGAALRAFRSAEPDSTARLERLEGEDALTQQAMRERLDALENLVEGLQDAVHRETVRRDAMIDELHKRLEPAELARALSDDARKRGL